MKIFKGKVISKKMAKTAVVAVERVVVHPVYKKRFRRTKKYHVHDEMGVEIGQEVVFTPSKPFSKTKRWIIIETDVKDKTKADSKDKKSTESQAIDKKEPKPRQKRKK